MVFNEKRTYDLTVYTGDVADQEYTIEPGFKASLTDINERIIRDSMQVGRKVICFRRSVWYMWKKREEHRRT